MKADDSMYSTAPTISWITHPQSPERMQAGEGGERLWRVNRRPDDARCHRVLADAPRVIAPARGYTRTPMIDRVVGRDPEAEGRMVMAEPMGRLAMPEEVAGSVL